MAMLEVKAADFLKYFATSPIGYRHKEILDKVDLNGDANIKLSITETLTGNQPTQLQADLNLLNNQLRFDDYPTGTINTASALIDAKGLKALNLTGNWLGEPTTVTTRNKIVEITGTLDASKLLEVVALQTPTLNKSN
jgi:uncharacterized protein YhdP